MPEYKNWLYEFIQEFDVSPSEVAEFVSIPKLDETGEFESLTANVTYKGERRKININKGNFKRLAEKFGTNTDLWHHKQFYIHLPESRDEKASKTKYILAPHEPGVSEYVVPATVEEKIAALKAKGLSDETIAQLKAINAL